VTFLELYGVSLDRELGSSSTVLFTTLRRKAAINEAQRAFNRLTECFTREASIALSNAVGEYDLEAAITAVDYLWLAKQGVEVKKIDASANVTYFAGDDLLRTTIQRLNREEPGWRTASAGNPSAHYLREDGGLVYLGLYPAPAVGAGETWTGIVPYVAQPADMTADADIPFTASSNAKRSLEPFHYALAHYAAGQLELLRKNTDGRAEQMQLFGGYVADYLGKQRPHGPQHVTFARDYSGGRGTRSQRNDPRRYP